VDFLNDPDLLSHWHQIPTDPAFDSNRHHIETDSMGQPGYR
jgi:hypothetical protein